MCNNLPVFFSLVSIHFITCIKIKMYLSTSILFVKYSFFSSFKLNNSFANDSPTFYTAGKPVTQESSLDVFCHVIFDVNIDVMDVRGRPQEFVAL